MPRIPAPARQIVPAPALASAGVALRALALTLGLALVLAAGAASAHSGKEVVVPAEGASVAGSPPEIRMEFDGAMRITRITLTDAAGKAHALERTDRMAPVTTFVATPGALPPGAYTVEWRGIATDGHAMEGGWSFTVE